MSGLLNSYLCALHGENPPELLSGRYSYLHQVRKISWQILLAPAGAWSGNNPPKAEQVYWGLAEKGCTISCFPMPIVLLVMDSFMGTGSIPVGDQLSPLFLCCGEITICTLCKAASFGMQQCFLLLPFREFKIACKCYSHTVLWLTLHTPVKKKKKKGN